MKRTSHIMWGILILVLTKSVGIEEATSGIFLNFHHVNSALVIHQIWDTIENISTALLPFCHIPTLFEQPFE